MNNDVAAKAAFNNNTKEEKHIDVNIGCLLINM